MGWLQCYKRINKKNWRIASAAAASSGTYGFSVGVRADLATTKQESSLKQTSSNKSSLNAKHININSTKDISITGSDLASKEDTSLNSNNLNINSSEDSLKYKSNTKSLTTGFGFTFYGANSSSLELGTNSLKQSEQSLTNNNSHLYSAKDMNINTANDATIKGANLRADERLNLKVGNNLSLESTRDIKDASSKSRGINLSASYSGATNAKNFASGDRSLSSVGASFSKSNSNTKIKQTNLSSITANELNVEVGKNTHLKGSLLAAGEYDKDNTFIDNHNLNLKTNTLSYENLSNTSYNKGSSLSIGANYQVGKKDDSKASQSDQGKSGSSYSGLKSINYSNQRNLSYSLSKNLATLGSGNIEIADKDNSDDLTRLNRDTTKLTKDLVNTSISSNVDGSMDLRVLTKSGQKEIAKEIVDANYGLKKLSEQMPDENSKNKIVSIMGKLLVYGSMVALDIIPTSYNNGGLFGQLVGSFGGKEIASDLISVFSKNSEKYELYKDKMVKLEDSKYFKTISPEKREELKKLSYFKDLYVSKEPLGIDVDTITHQNFGNGILNTPMEAIMNGLEQTGQIKKDGTRLAGNTIELTIKYNPTRGFFSDLLEAAQDKFSIGTSDMAKQVGSFISDVTKAAEEKRKKDNKIFAVNFAAHSQLNTLVYNGVKWGIGNELYRHLDGVKSLMKKGKGSPYTVSSFGSPVDVEKMRDVLEAAKIGIAGTFSNKGDFVAEGLGGNKDVNKKADMADRINVLNIPKLFMDDSPHGSYVCQDYEKDGARCGVNFQY
ncbi:hemagglutinin repeat-containing protein [Campylobacter concisus]|uniref:hemagglutinin repeat-containing protein n=1 Tax=Campylobacter concisus TaxID=199 RepID=UPI001959A152|nr:hemagglutinin repeat-containing protein [Campylobacter concisus]VTY00173.1 Haemagluttinin repeat protein [Campylobacter concisus]